MTADTRRTLLAAAGVFAVSLVHSMRMLAPSVDFVDAGELAAVAHTFGVAHPTGYPLWTLLAGLWALLPVGSGIWRLNLLSAVYMAAAAAMMVPLVLRLLAFADPRRGGGRERGGREARGRDRVPQRASGAPVLARAELSGAERLVAAVFGALLLAFSQTYSATALAVEVYPLHVLLVTVLLWLFAGAVLDAGAAEQVVLRRLRALAFVLGLSFANHMTTIMLAPAFLVLFFLRFGMGADAWRRIGRAAPFFLLGLLPYLYLPLRAAAGPALNWGNPVDLERFLWHVRGKQYSVWMFTGSAAKQLGAFVSSYLAEFAWAGGVTALAGAVLAFRRHRRAGLFLALLFTGCVFWAVNYDIHDIETYYLLAYVVSGVWASYALAWVLLRLGPQRFAFGVTGAAAVVLVTGVLVSPRVDQSGNHLVEDYTTRILREAAPRALILSYQWDYFVSAAYYFQMVERMRPDVVVLDKELFRRSWYLAQLERNHPDVVAGAARELADFRAQLDLFEHDRVYDAARIESAFNALINRILEDAMRTRPVYVTVEIEPQFGAGLERVPEGLLFRLVRPGADSGVPLSLPDDYTFRPFSSDHPLVIGITGMYATMAANRGMYLLRAGQTESAARCIRRAVALRPDDPQIRALEAQLGAARGPMP